MTMRAILSKTLLCIIGALWLAIPLQVESASKAPAKPAPHIRTANYFLHAGKDLPKSQYATLAQYDVVVLPMEAAVYNRDFFTYARKKHPGIILLPYVPARSINTTDIHDAARIRKQLMDLVQPSWYLKDTKGELVKAWTGTVSINITTQWQWTLPYFVKNSLLANGLWDGVFYDEWDDDIHTLGKNIDLNGDGVAEDADVQNAAWRASNVKMLQYTRALLGPDKYIVINGSSLPEYFPYINGRLFEDFPTPWHGKGRWEDSMDAYLWMENKVASPHLFIVSGVPQLAGIEGDYQAMRYALASTLLGDGYFSFDPGRLLHGSLWRYDEYNIDLGKPLSPPWLIGSSGYQAISAGLWRRDFVRGIVIVNATNEIATVELGGIFYAFKGTQDPLINSGKKVQIITLRPRDGLILLKKK